MKKQLDVIRTGFEERTTWTAEQQALSEEIAQTESELTQVRASIDGMSNDPTTGMAKLVRATVREAELQAYLKGLQFKGNLQDRHVRVQSEVYA